MNWGLRVISRWLKLGMSEGSVDREGVVVGGEGSDGFFEFRGVVEEGALCFGHI